ncbi:DUF3540 domain-containing protein [Bordetella bronchialis]|nr:DUF3540 domain-containing protein [Bordetella bronchialis]
MNSLNAALRSEIPGPAGTAPAPATTPAYGPGARMYHARLVMRDGARYGALTEEGASWVTAAAGCLLQPEVGDLVLLSVAAGQGYILTVLERGTPESIACIEIPGSLRLSVPDGRLEVQARQGVALDAGDALSLRAQSATAAFDRAEVASESLRLAGQDMHTCWTTRTDVSGTRLDIATRGETHLAQSVRRIAGHEDVSAGSLRQTVDEDWSVQAATADLKARDRVAIDAGSVQIG